MLWKIILNVVHLTKDCKRFDSISCVNIVHVAQQWCGFQQPGVKRKWLMSMCLCPEFLFFEECWVLARFHYHLLWVNRSSCLQTTRHALATAMKNKINSLKLNMKKMGYPVAKKRIQVSSYLNRLMPWPDYLDMADWQPIIFVCCGNSHHASAYCCVWRTEGGLKLGMRFWPRKAYVRDLSPKRVLTRDTVESKSTYMSWPRLYLSLV